MDEGDSPEDGSNKNEGDSPDDVRNKNEGQSPDDGRNKNEGQSPRGNKNEGESSGQTSKYKPAEELYNSTDDEEVFFFSKCDKIQK